jgi:flagellar FliL protein
MAKEEAKEKKEEGGEHGGDAAPKKGGKKLFLIIGAAVAVLAAAGVPIFVLGGQKPAEGHEVQEEEQHGKELASLPLETIIVNLSESSAFIKIGMSFEYDTGPITKAEEELAKKGHGGGGGGHGKEEGGLSGYFKEREPMLKDALIKVLSSKRSTEVLSMDGKERLKEELIEAANEALALEDSPIQGVYFSEFIIQ